MFLRFAALRGRAAAEDEGSGDHDEHHLLDRPRDRPLRTAFGFAKSAEAVTAAFGRAPTWYRDASARYSRDAVTLIGTLGYRIAGYSLNADVGASLPAVTVAKRLAAARPGDVVIAHINHPERPAGAGVALGIKALVARGVRFERLDTAFPQPTG